MKITKKQGGIFAALLVLILLITKSMKAAKPAQTPEQYNIETKKSVNTNVRAVRNLNPGNVRDDGKSEWQGKIGIDEKGFIRFGTMEMGARCMVKLLRNYSKLHGLDTIEKVITRYAPSVENNTKSYIEAVAKNMKLSSTQPLQLQTSVTNLATLAYWMHVHEAGFAWVDYKIFEQYAKEFTV